MNAKEIEQLELGKYYWVKPSTESKYQVAKYTTCYGEPFEVFKFTNGFQCSAAQAIDAVEVETLPESKKMKSQSFTAKSQKGDGNHVYLSTDGVVLNCDNEVMAKVFLEDNTEYLVTVQKLTSITSKKITSENH